MAGYTHDNVSLAMSDLVKLIRKTL